MSLNRYAYVANNPTNWVDPLGLGNQKSSEQSGPPQLCYVGDVLVDWSLCQLAMDAAAAQVSALTSELANETNNPLYRLKLLLGVLSSCKAASAMVNDLNQLLSSGKLTLGNLGGADGSTSFTGSVSIDSTYGITAHNLGHEWWHTVQRQSIISPLNYSSPVIAGGPVADFLIGQVMWRGAQGYNAVSSLFNGTPGFGPLDQEADAIGQSISHACGID